MQYARCVVDDQVWEAEKFAALPNDELEEKRRNLLCVECNEFAWFRKESTHGHPAHFCAHHSDDCDLRVDYIIVDDPLDDATIDEEQVDSGDTIIVRLDQEQGNDVEVAQVEPPANPGQGQGGRTHRLIGQGRETLQHFTLRRLLLRLVQSPKFRRSNTKVVFYRNEEDILIQGLVRDIVTSFDEIDPSLHDGETRLYWGPISSAKTTPDGKIWLNSSDNNNSTSIAIFEDIADQFLQVFNILDLDSLMGAHVLTAGTCHISKRTGKPTIWCGSPKYIIIRRYRDPNLAALK